MIIRMLHLIDPFFFLALSPFIFTPTLSISYPRRSSQTGFIAQKGNLINWDVHRDSTCYKNGQPKFCEPRFSNTAYVKPVSADSICGKKQKSDYCLSQFKPALRKIRRTSRRGGRTVETFISANSVNDTQFEEVCGVCDATRDTLSHPPAFITDHNSNKNLTCWLSEPGQKNVTVKIKLGKTYELRYIVIQFCGQIPDEIAFYKSANFGETWTPYQYFSTNCLKNFGMEANQRFTQDSITDAHCTDAHKALTNVANNNGLGVNLIPTSNQVVFLINEGRPGSEFHHKHPILQDWATVTDIRVDLLGPETPPLHYHEGNLSTDFQESKRLIYAISDISAFGRCKCNGHADSCKADRRTGNLKCDCKHNTEGRDCERCKDFFQDLPWKRGTNSSANECRQCKCNLHSNKCRHDKKVFQMTDYRSGGVCLDCQHNTAGINCERCRSGYTRDRTKDITEIDACKKCMCHPIGSLTTVCSPSSGQCICKTGVTGTTCHRCAIGYKQTMNKKDPCLRDPTYVPGQRQKNSLQDSNRNSHCPKCRAHPKKINFKKFCNHDYAMKAQLINAVKFNDGWLRVTFTITDLFKVGLGVNTEVVRVAEDRWVWIPPRSQHCRCPNLHKGQKYLVMGRGDIHNRQNRFGFTFNRNSLFYPWPKYQRRQQKLTRRLTRFKHRESDGKCQYRKTGRQNMRSSKTQPFNRQLATRRQTRRRVAHNTNSSDSRINSQPFYSESVRIPWKP